MIIFDNFSLISSSIWVLAVLVHWGIIRGIPIAYKPRWNATYVGKQWLGSILNAFCPLHRASPQSIHLSIHSCLSPCCPCFLRALCPEGLIRPAPALVSQFNYVVIPLLARRTFEITFPLLSSLLQLSLCCEVLVVIKKLDTSPPLPSSLLPIHFYRISVVYFFCG